tara:strand:- start:1671 stop:2006 length:336 start_codon:yes stop_codon:yes gene_type:complete
MTPSEDKMPKKDIFKEEEIRKVPKLKSDRIFKSATPKYTLDWYVKWVASIFVLAAMSMRGLEGLQIYDLSLSVVGIVLWLWVSVMWNDRALIILNGVGLIFLIRNLVDYLT